MKLNKLDLRSVPRTITLTSLAVIFSAVGLASLAPLPTYAEPYIPFEAVCRLYNPRTGDHLYTTNLAENAALIQAGSYHSEGLFGATVANGNALPGLVPIYREYNPATGDHFYTANFAESVYTESNLGYRAEGNIGYVLPFTNDPSDIAIYRFWNPTTRHHFYTANPDEASALLGGNTWRYEGVVGFLPFSRGGDPC